ncbi:hypothetical protein ACE6H2_012383 [Prunus campanulata]
MLVAKVPLIFCWGFRSDLIIEYCGRYANKEKITDSTQLEESTEEMSDEDIREMDRLLQVLMKLLDMKIYEGFFPRLLKKVHDIGGCPISCTIMKR